MTAAELFVETFARQPEGVWSAPGRVNLIGDHTDYNGGLALPFAIGRRTWVAAARRDAGVRAVSTHDDAHWRQYVEGIVSVLDTGGVDVAVTSDVPIGAGLSSSAALACALAAAVAGVYALDLAPRDLALVAQRVENEHVGVPSGLLDQLAVVLARARHVLEIDFGHDAERLVPFDPVAFDVRVLVIDTRVRRRLGDGRYAERRAECEAAAAALGVATLREAHADDILALDEPLQRRARHALTENDRVRAAVTALEQHDVELLGALLTASHRSLRDDFEVSCAELDAAVDAALDAGALGARLTGGGFGGCAIALVRDADVAAVEHAVMRAFAERGWRMPAVEEVVPSDGAS